VQPLRTKFMDTDHFLEGKMQRREAAKLVLERAHAVSHGTLCPHAGACLAFYF
jgi:hypothetical protein